MRGRLFTLVDARDESRVFAWGMEIEDGADTDVVVYRRDPETGHTTFGVHNSAAAALHRYSMIAPMELLWESDDWTVSEPGSIGHTRRRRGPKRRPRP